LRIRRSTFKARHTSKIKHYINIKSHAKTGPFSHLRFKAEDLSGVIGALKELQKEIMKYPSEEADNEDSE
jgi:hypothetical protein